MRLLERLENGDFELVSFNDDDCPPYAILSHTWTEGQEVTFDDVTARTGREKTGYDKIRFCIDRAAKDDLRYCWVDTCCIDKSSAAAVELTTAINSMFRWYQRASKCYVYLSDLHVPEEVTDAQTYRISWLEAFRRSRWFTRGWTLQELVAPPAVEFFSKEGKLLGTRISLEKEVHDITKIPIEVLRGQSLGDFSIDERMSWGAHRITTIKEDKIYCLLGIFGVFLPLIYGEGEVYAAKRLREEIQRRQEGYGIQRLQDLTISSPVDIAVSKLSLDGKVSGNALLLRLDSNGAVVPPKSSVWSLSGLTNDSRKEVYYEVPAARKVARFIGQKSTLSKIDDHFKSLLLEDNLTPCITTLVGMGGIGKTQLALEYCKVASSRERENFHDVFWFNAASEETLRTDFMKFATLLAPPNKPFRSVAEGVEFVLSALNTWKRRLLVVFDNFDDPSFTNVLEYVPVMGTCGVLITSRLREAGQEFGAMIEVPLMSNEDAHEVLASRLGLKGIPEDQLIDCQRVVDLLGCLPLALEQTGAYMASGGGHMSFKEFIQHFETRKKDIMEITPKFWKYTNTSDPKVKSANLSILTTWEMSVDRLGCSLADRQKKMHFFTVMCFLSSTRISRLLFENYSKFFDEVPANVYVGDWMSIFKSTELTFDEVKFREVVVELANLSLIRQFADDISSNSFIVNIHPLIREWAQFRESIMERRRFALEASFIVAALLSAYRRPVLMISFESMISNRKGIDDWRFAVLLREIISEVLAHMDTCVAHWKTFQIRSQEAYYSSIEDIFWVESFFADVYTAAYQLDKGYEMLERQHSTSTAHLGEDHITSLKISLEMCSIRIQQGRGLEVRNRLESLVEHHEALKNSNDLINNHSIAQFWLATLYTRQGDTMKAKVLAKTLLISFLHMDLSEESETKIFIANFFANYVLSELGLHEESETLRRSLLARYLKRINSSLPKSAREREIMGMLNIDIVGHLLDLHERNRDMGALDEAEQLLQNVDKFTDDTSHPMDRYTLIYYHALVLAARGLWSKAAERTELAYKYCAEVIGPLHPVTNGRKYVLLKQILRAPEKNVDRAAGIVNEALRVAAEQLGPAHEKVLALQSQSANFLYNEDQKRLALPLYENVILRMSKKIALSDPQMVEAQSNFANCLYFLPNRSEEEGKRAMVLYQELIQLEQAEAKSDTSTRAQIHMRNNLGLLLRHEGKYSEALPLYQEALAKQKSLVDQENIVTWTIQQSIAACYRFQREFHTALEVLKKLHEEQTVVLEPTQEHSTAESYASTFTQMGHCYSKLDFDREPTAYADGVDCYGRALQIYLTGSNGALNANISSIYYELGNLHHKRKRYIEAAENYERTCQFSRQKRDEGFFFDIVRLGEALRLAEAWEKQKGVLLERLDWAKEFRGPDSEATMLSVANLAVNAENLKDIESALKFRKEELVLRQKLFKENPGETINCLDSVAVLSYHLGDSETSQSMTLEILRIRSTLPNYDRKDDMRFLSDLATYEGQMMNWEASIAYCQQVMEFHQSENNRDEVTLPLIGAEIQMAISLYALERFLEAETHATRALEMRSKLHEAEHILTQKSRFWLAKIVFQLGKHDQAMKLFNQCMPELQKMEHLSPHWQRLWAMRIESAHECLRICRLKLLDGVPDDG